MCVQFYVEILSVHELIKLCTLCIHPYSIRLLLLLITVSYNCMYMRVVCLLSTGYSFAWLLILDLNVFPLYLIFTTIYILLLIITRAFLCIFKWLNDNKSYYYCKLQRLSSFTFHITPSHTRLTQKAKIQKSIATFESRVNLLFSIFHI